MSDEQTYRRLLRNMRLMTEHKAEVQRVEVELRKRGLLDLADDLHLSLKKITHMTVAGVKAS